MNAGLRWGGGVEQRNGSGDGGSGFGGANYGSGTGIWIVGADEQTAGLGGIGELGHWPASNEGKIGKSGVFERGDVVELQLAVTFPGGIERRREFPYSHFLKVSYFG